MTKVFSVRHPAKNESSNWGIGCRYWQFLACGKDVRKAIILDHFIRLLENIIDLSSLPEHAKCKSYYIHDTSKVIFEVRLSHLREALFGLANERTLSRLLDELVELGFISFENDPNPAKPGTPPSRAKFVCLHPEVCNAWIEENYNQDGSLKNPQIHQTTKVQNGPKCKNAEWGRVHQTAKMQNGPKGKFAEWRKEQTEDAQLTENNENSVNNSPNCKNAEWPYIYNQYQSTQSINSINQGKNEISSHLEKQKTVAGEAETISETLVKLGMPSEKLSYPDVEPTIERLQQSGATQETFKQAFENSLVATQGKGFGLNYLAKAVESILKKNNKSDDQNISTPKKRTFVKEAKPQDFDKYEYKSNTKNAAHWAGDIIN